MLKIPVIKGNINKALKQFKRKFRNTKTLQKIREHKNFIRKSIKKKLIKEKAILKQKYQEEND